MNIQFKKPNRRGIMAKCRTKLNIRHSMFPLLQS